MSGILAGGSLAFGSQVLGAGQWNLTTQASMAPVPEWLPRLAVLPTELFTWAQQDLLALGPLLAVALALLTVCIESIGARPAQWVAGWLPRSLSGRLQLTVGGLAALTLVVGWVGFSALEDMHFRGHQLQLQARFRSAIVDADIAFGAEELAHATGADALTPISPSLIAERADWVNHSILSFFGGLFAHGTLRRLARLSTNGLASSVHIAHVEWISPPQQGPEAF